MPTKTSRSADALHPIAVVAERTGLSRDVIRVWERRYGAVQPTRSEGGQRRYSDADVRRLQLLADATRKGRNISLVADLDTAELARLVAEDQAARPISEPPEPSGARRESVEQALVCTRALDGTGLDRVLRRAVARHGLAAFIDDVAPTLMRRVGDEWHAGRLSIAQEHLASQAVLALLFQAMRAVPETPKAPCLLVATPAGERHGVGAALAAAAAALDGWKVAFLGMDVPAGEVVAAVATTDAAAVALSVVYTEDRGGTMSELRRVRAGVPDGVPIFVGGAAVMEMEGQLAGAGIVVCRSVAHLRALLAREWTSA